MNTSQLHKKILALLKRSLAPEVLATLLRELRRAEAAERRLLGATRTTPSGKKGFSLADRATLDQVITFCNSAMRPGDVADVVMECGDLLRDEGELLRAEELYTIAILQAGEAGEVALAGNAYLRRGDLYSRQGRWKESAADLNASRRFYRTRQDRTGLGRVENITGTNFAIQGKLRKAEACYVQALRAFEKSEEKLMTGTVLMNLGIVQNILGRYDEALGYYRRARSYFDKLGNVQRLMELHHNMGMSHLFKESYKEARSHFDTAISYATTLHHVTMLATASLGKANACHHTKDYRLALVFANQAMHFYSLSNDRCGLADSYKMKGIIHRDMKQFAVAVSLFQTSLRMNAELRNDLNSAETFFALGVLEQMRNKTQEARKAFLHALDHFTRVGAAKEIERTRKELAAVPAPRRKSIPA